MVMMPVVVPTHWCIPVGNFSPLRFVGVHFEHQPELFQVVGAARAARGFPRAGQGRQKNGCQNPDDGDDHQQLNQCETSVSHDISLLVVTLPINGFRLKKDTSHAG